MIEIADLDVPGRRRRGLELLRSLDSADAATITVLSSFNVDLLPPLLVEALDRHGIAGRVDVGDFGQIAHEVLNPAGRLYAAEPDYVLLIPAVEDVLAPLWTRRPSELGADEAAELADAAASELETVVATLLERLPAATCIVLPYATGRAPVETLLDPRSGMRGQRAVEAFLARARDLRALSPRVVVVDWDWHLRSAGARTFVDDRLWYLGRMRANPLGLAAMGELVAGHVAAYRGTARKVAVVDLDGTIWGGVVGEAGVAGLELGSEGVGFAFQDFQRELCRLRDAGVLLAICSKNNPEDVREAFDGHPEMVLQREDFAGERVNWDDKATNLRALAAELNLGTDSFVFIDDNPVERDWVAQALPEVLVPDLPADPSARPAFLRSLACFRRIDLTDADRRRSADYAALGSRRRLESRLPTFEDFLSSLAQVVTVEPVHEASLPRAAQLSQRTNQFNLTTRRYTAADIERMLADGSYELHTLALSDRFGDSGITGLAIIRVAGDDAEIDTLLLSCRVLGRRVEDAFLAFVADRARARGARFLTGRYLPTPKNGQVARFYPDRGFAEAGEGEYRLDLAEHVPAAPGQIELKVPAGA